MTSRPTAAEKLLPPSPPAFVVVLHGWLIHPAAQVRFPITWDLKGSMVGRQSGSEKRAQKDPRTANNPTVPYPTHLTRWIFFAVQAVP